MGAGASAGVGVAIKVATEKEIQAALVNVSKEDRAKLNGAIANALEAKLAGGVKGDGGSIGSNAPADGRDVSSSRQSMIGTDGATSLKAEIVARIPELKTASQFREARRLLREELGGVWSLRDELIFCGVVDPDTGLLTTNGTPENVFARVASGTAVQAGMAEEQSALGAHQDKFVVCCNTPENDLHWDSCDKMLVKKASMSRRHRFLTTKDIHFKWFNVLIFGMLPPDEGGCTAKEALDKVLSMKAAAQEYAEKSGWSAKVGLFLNVFGHNHVNSLFLHILDLECTGPAFEALKFKNCPIDDVITVLQEELAIPMPRSFSGHKPVASKRSSVFASAEGATSLKDELVARVPELRDTCAFREMRRVLRDELGGAHALVEELARSGYVDMVTGQLTTGDKPFNLFARCAAGAMQQLGMEAENEALGDFRDRFMICCNKPENDEHWDSEDPQWLGKASMSQRHRFLTTKNLHWQWFNALAFGMVAPEDGGEDLANIITELQAMQTAALTYAAARKWSTNVGLFVHVFGHNSVNSLHIHILDMDVLGPTGRKFEYKNTPFNDVLEVLKEEAAAKLSAAAHSCL